MRLRPHDDLKASIQEFAARNKITAGIIVTCVGSLEQFNLRFANQREGQLRKRFFEILSLEGTVSQTTVHLHICLGDQTGVTTGGHLLERNLVYTTAKIAIAELTGLEFHREPDPVSGYAELEIRQK
jgi:hypothetical protein